VVGRLTGKATIVTGAGSGIGAATVKLFCAEGASVLAVDISGMQTDLAASIGPACIPHHADVSSEDDVRHMIEACVEHFGRVDILCNNAGIDGPNTLTADYGTQEYDRVMSVNARSVFLGMKHAIPIMHDAGGGVIVNTASIAGQVSFANMMAYCGTKGAVIAMTRTTAVEYAAHNIRINCVCPGVIRTAIFDTLPPEYAAAAEAAAPMKRAGRPEEIASTILFLASEDASFVTGTALVVDGGYTAI